MSEEPDSEPLNFTDQKSLEAWLETRSQEDCVAIAARAALRSVPMLSAAMTARINDPGATIILPVFRAISVSSSSRWGIDEELAGASASAHASASAAAHASASAAAAASAHASASAAASAHSAADSAARSAAYSVAFSAAFSAAWEILSSDVTILATESRSALLARPLWPGDMLDGVAEKWQSLKSALLTAEDENGGEDWVVWTDWYENQRRGGPFDPTLERAIALIPDDIWEQGPKAVSVRIRRLQEERRQEKRAEAERNVSPTATLDAQGKLDAHTNPRAAPPDDSPDLPTLLRRQRGVIGVILNALATTPGNDFRSVPGAIRRYDGEIESNGIHLSIDFLDDMRATARAEYLSRYSEKYFDTEGGIRRAFLNFFKLHKEIATHYAPDAKDDPLSAPFGDTIDRPDPQALETTLTKVKETLAVAIEAEAVTADFASYMGGMMDDVADVGFTPPLAGIPNEETDPDLPDTPGVNLQTRIYTRTAAFAGSAVREIKKIPVGTSVGIAGFLQTPAGKPFLDVLVKLRDLLWALFV